MLPRTSVAAQRLFASDTRTFPLSKDFKGHKLEKLPETTVETSKDEMMKMFRDMATIRRFETKAGELYRAKNIRGFCHLYSGQEACAVGIKAAMRSQDSLITAYRVHGWAYVLGWSVKAVMAELFGNSAGCSVGKGGSMHMYGKNFYGGNGIVGAQVPVGAGVALKHQYSGDGGVNFALYGDGASNQGQVFEAYNIAKLWKLPVVFVCENNKFGMGTSASRSSASTQYYTRGDYVPGIWVDGMDVLAVKQATKFAIDHALSEGPIVMELETYRYHGHSMSDPDTTYRTRDDIKNMREKFDPIITARKRIVEAGWATEEDLTKVEKEVRALVDEETQAALEAPATPLTELVNHIYLEKVSNVRGCDLYTSYSQ